MAGTERSGASRLDVPELREILATVYTPSGVKVWIEWAEKHEITLTAALVKARQIASGFHGA